jgi:GNAT superfamily N-acetyltransferase
MKKIKYLINIFALLFFYIVHADLRYEIVCSKDIMPHVEAITNLCLIVFKEYPYLYDGYFEEYVPFIKGYAQSEHGIGCLLFDDNKLVGVAIGCPLNEICEKTFQKPFIEHNYQNLHQFFYLGELVLLKEYRGKGHGKKLYYTVENEVIKKGFPTIYFCKIIEFDNHPLMPADYYSLDSFWTHLGFQTCQDLQFNGFWKVVGKTEVSTHPMIFWMKQLSGLT